MPEICCVPAASLVFSVCCTWKESCTSSFVRGTQNERTDVAALRGGMETTWLERARSKVRHYRGEVCFSEVSPRSRPRHCQQRQTAARLRLRHPRCAIKENLA